MKSVGVLGLGIIGGVYPRNFHAAGVLGWAWNRSPKGLLEFIAGSGKCADAALREQARLL